jgi:hypothetical protein
VGGTGSSGGTGGTGGGPGRPAEGGAFTVGTGEPLGIGGIGDVDIVGLDAVIDWAVPAVTLTVPGLLLILAVLAQTLGGVLWLPVARRWLGGFGLRRRRARELRPV